MEQTILQQRIEERAKIKLLNDLLTASNRESEIASLITGFKPQLNVRIHYGYNNHRTIVCYNDYSEQLSETLLPEYIKRVTDEILGKIDEIDYLLQDKEEVELDLPY